MISTTKKAPYNMKIETNALRSHCIFYLYSSTGYTSLWNRGEKFMYFFFVFFIFNYLFDLGDCEFKWNNIIQPFNVRRQKKIEEEQQKRRK